MLAFYIDETLSQSEQMEVIEQLAEFGEDVGSGLEFKRIPYVFPADGNAVKNEEMIEVFKGHIRNAGVPTGDQCVFIMPKDGIRWALLLQMAFEAVVGYFPYIVQPWTQDSYTEDAPILRSEWMRVTNMNGVMSAFK